LAILKLFAMLRRYFIDLPHIWPLPRRKSMTGRDPCAAGFSIR